MRSHYDALARCTSNLNSRGLLLAVASGMGAQTYGLDGKLFPSDTVGTDGFGGRLSLSADGTRALVASKSYPTDCRIVRVFDRGAAGWQEVAVLTPSLPPQPDTCSSSVVALSGDGQTAWVQDPYYDVVTVFVRNGTTWGVQQALQLPQGLSSGSTPDPVLSFDGNTALIGAPGYHRPGCEPSSCGAGFVYVRSNNTWTMEQMLLAPSFEPNANLGTGVALSGDGQTALLGDRYVNQATGAAYIFTRSGSTWSFQQKLEAPDGTTYDDYGEPVALSFDGAAAMIGSGRHCHGQFLCGFRHVYAYDRSGTIFSLTQEVAVQIQQTSFSAVGGDIALSANGRRAVVGLRYEDCIAGESCGAAVFLERAQQGPWMETQRLVGTDEDDHFGTALDMSANGNTAAIGASGEDCALGPYCGAAYVLVDKCPPDIFVMPLDCLDHEQFPHEWIYVGCAVVDCCPWCPGSALFRIDWVIRYEADPVETAVLRFENLSRRDLADLQIRGPGTWLGVAARSASPASRFRVRAGFSRRARRLAWRSIGSPPRGSALQPVLGAKSGPDAPS